MEITFKRDTAIRKQYFTPESFAHPAKMDCQLLMWIVEQYTKAGETILDPMAGMGTTMLACTMGRNVVLVELEQKFIRMCLNNWEKVKMMPQLGHTMGECPVLWGDARNIISAREHPYENLWLKYPSLDYATIKAIRRHYNLALKGDARQLEGLLVDKIVTSPPYAETAHHSDDPADTEKYRPHRTSRLAGTAGENPDNIGNLPYGSIDSVITSPPYTERMDGGTQLQKGFVPYSGEPDGWFTTRPQDNIGNLRYGNIDSIITSPPYEEAMGKKHHSPRADKLAKEKSNPVTYTDRIDHIITSPPYEASLSEPEDRKHSIDQSKWGDGRKIAPPHSQVHLTYPASSEGNIGNLKSDSYLSAMLQVYQQCHKVLKPQGLMILVTKNFIRNRQIVRLDLDTIKLCEQAGFKFLERHYRILTSISFWRTIYKQRYPDAPEIKEEDILVFRK